LASKTLVKDNAKATPINLASKDIIKGFKNDRFTQIEIGDILAKNT